MMTNKEIYRKTLTFSLHRLLFDFLAIVLLSGLCIGGYVLMDKTTDKGLIGLLVGLVIGLIAVYFVTRYVSYTYKAGQIAMMTKGITEGRLPDNTLAEGKAIVRKRFGTVAGFFIATRIIRGIFSQLGRGLTSLGGAVGGDTGRSVGSAISSAIQVVVAYLCDCCLGWVFYRESEKTTKATCEGAVLFFRHGKTLAKNLGRVFGLGILSFLVIGGAFFGMFFAIFSALPPTVFEALANEMHQIALNESTKNPQIFQTLSDPKVMLIAAAVLAAVILWSLLHSVFVRPFVLVGVLRNYIQSGIDDVPTEESFNMLDGKSDKFRKLHKEAA